MANAEISPPGRIGEGGTLQPGRHDGRPNIFRICWPPMSNSDPLVRSPELMSAADTTLLVVDVQEKLVRLVPGARRIICHCIARRRCWPARAC